MLKPSSRIRSSVLAAVACGLLVVAGCSSGDEDSTDASATLTESAEGGSGADFSACAPATAPLTEMTQAAETEPAVSVPLPAGWQENTAVENGEERVIAANPELMTDSFAANYTLSLVSSEASEPQAVIDAEVGKIQPNLMGTVGEREPLTVCGFTAERVAVSYPAQAGAPGRDGSTLVVAVPTGESLYAVVVAVETTDPAQGSYGADVDAIFGQLQVGLPAD